MQRLGALTPNAMENWKVAYDSPTLNYSQPFTPADSTTTGNEKIKYCLQSGLVESTKVNLGSTLYLLKQIRVQVDLHSSNPVYKLLF